MRTHAWPWVACSAIGLPALVAYNLPPSATFFNQALAIFGWGAWLVLLAAALPRLSARSPSALKALLAALALPLLTALASPLWTRLPWSLSLSSAGLIAAAALAALMGSAIQRSGHGVAAFRAFCIALVIAGVVSSVIGIVQVFTPQWADGNWIARSSVEGRAVGNLRQPNHLSSLLLWSLVAVAWLGEARVVRRGVALTLAMLLLFAVVLSGSRTGALGALMLALWGVLDRRLSRPARVMLWLVPLVYALYWVGVTTWTHPGQQVFGSGSRFGAGGDISSSRFGIWSNTLALIAAHPWAGVGFGEFNFAWTLTPFPGRPVAFFDHTHNLPLQLAVELGLPLAALVLGLLGWALWCALRNAIGTGIASNGAQIVMLRAAFVMVLMVLVHSLLEYPLWYAYFLLPAAFAFGLCLGGEPEPGAAESAVRPARALQWASALLALGGVVSVVDYQRVVVIFAPPENAPPLAQRIADGQRSWFFSHHADYAAATTAEHPSDALGAFAGAPHYLLDARLMQAWAKALDEAGQTDRARHVAQRLKEFRNEEAAGFFAPCNPGATPALDQPFQCLAPTSSLGYLDFR